MYLTKTSPHSQRFLPAYFKMQLYTPLDLINFGWHLRCLLASVLFLVRNHMLFHLLLLKSPIIGHVRLYRYEFHS